MKMLDNIRYVHCNSIFRKWNGFTIAYSRSDNNIVFAVALVKHTDKYDKAVGRKISSERLEAMKPYINTTTSYYDQTCMTGNITLQRLIANTNVYQSLDSILSDQLISKLHVTDFKHSFLSTELINFFCGEMDSI